jgi:ATP-binding cassette subfamily B protein/subfamily B ATP-binding cassette protein MsbA
MTAAHGRWLRHLKPQWRSLATGSAAMAIRAGVLALTPWPLKYIVDNVLYRKPLPPILADVLPDAQTRQVSLLAALCLLTLALGLADALLEYAGTRLFLDAGQRVVFALRQELFAHLQRLSMDFHRRHRGGDLMSRLGDDVLKLQDLITAVGGDFIQHVLVMASIAVIMLGVDWRYGLVVLSTIPVFFVVIHVYSALLRRALRRVRKHEGDLWGMAQEALGSVQLIQAYGRESHEEQRFADGASKIFHASSDANDLQAQFSPAMTLAVAVATGLIAWYGAIHVIDGRITAGEMLVFLAYFRALTAPTRRIAKTARIVGRASVAVERVAEYLVEAPSVAESPAAVAPSHCTGLIEFDGVSFGYKPGPNILKDVTFRLQPGQTVALVGPTGAGKSTIAGLISRFYDPVLGRVLLDGHDLRGLKLNFVRRQVALVLQEPVIFQASAWENICYGLEGATRDDAIRAAKAVGIDEIIERLPGGYDCVVSERGQTLSGGQRQCISLARAMLSNAPIVILDEPSSNLDAVTEHRLMEAVKRLMANRTSLVIAHRLKTVVEADEILVLDQGRVVQRGRHAQLLKESGVYAALWSSLGNRDDVAPAVKPLIRTA